MTFKQDISRAVKAEAILNDPLVIEAFEKIRSTIFTAIEECPVRDQEGLHNLKLMLTLSSNLKACFEDIVNTGKVAEFNLKKLGQINE